MFFQFAASAAGVHTLTAAPADGTTNHAPMAAITLAMRTILLIWTPFPVNAAFGDDYGPAVTDQRHRAVFNGIWNVGYGFQLSGIYFYGSGERFAVTSGAGVSTTLIGAAGSDRVRADGTIVPRNSFAGLPIHRLDMRLQRRFKIVGGIGGDGIVEVFNVFNRANYGGYVTNESSLQYGQATSSTNLSYAPRSLQLGFRMSF